jgi:hypothetical protein
MSANEPMLNQARPLVCSSERTGSRELDALPSYTTTLGLISAATLRILHAVLARLKLHIDGSRIHSIISIDGPLFNMRFTGLGPHPGARKREGGEAARSSTL